MLFGKRNHASNRRDKNADENYIPQFALPGSSELVTLREESWGQILLRWVQNLFLYVLLLAVVGAALYSGLAANLLSFSPTGSASGEQSLVLRNTWQENGGKPPVGEEAVISATEPLPDDPIGKIRVGWTGITDPATVTVLSNNMDRLQVRGDEVQVGDQWVKLTNSAAYEVTPDAAEAPVQLDGQFLVQCVEGACEPGSYTIIDQAQIYGERRGL